MVDTVNTGHSGAISTNVISLALKHQGWCALVWPSHSKTNAIRTLTLCKSQSKHEHLLLRPSVLSIVWIANQCRSRGINEGDNSSPPCVQFQFSGTTQPSRLKVRMFFLLHLSCHHHPHPHVKTLKWQTRLLDKIKVPFRTCKCLYIIRGLETMINERLLHKTQDFVKNELKPFSKFLRGVPSGKCW